MVNKSSINILLIEDDVLLGSSLSEFLTFKGYSVKWVISGEEISTRDLINSDLIILDLILPGLKGEDLLVQIKHRLPDIPVIVLTAKDTIDTKKECFEKGIDDYITKPFDVTELLLRIKAVLRRAREKGNECIYRIGDVTIDTKRGIVIKGQNEITLSKRAWTLLEFLLEKRGTIVSKEEILNRVWHDAVVSEESIRSYIKELRKFLPEGAITTFKGRGYRLN